MLLVPTDFSSSSRDAVRLAARLAASLEARLLLLHVAEIPPPLEETSMIRPLPDQEPMPLGRFMREACMGELERYADELRAMGIAVETCVEIGPPLESIARVARERSPAMIIVGTHEESGMPHPVFGAIAEDVIRATARPVLTVPKRTRIEEPMVALA
jgi:nucleotide-binding universal stress UspA family protein